VSGDLQNTSLKPTGKKAKKLSRKEQSELFVETARKLESDESGSAFDNAIGVILPNQKQNN